MPTHLSRSELKDRVLQFLRSHRETQFENLVQLGIERPIGRALTVRESRELLEIVHELLTSNVLMPAADRHNTGWPFFSVTSHGQEILASAGPPVYDYDGFLADLRGRTAIEPIVERFLSEALQAYQRHLYLAAVVMLAAASENAIWQLINVYLDSIDDPINREKLRGRIASRDISTAYKRFRESFDSTSGQLPQGRPPEFDTHIEAVFTFTRLLRNAILHTVDLPLVTHAVAYGSLQQFSYYLPTLASVIASLKDTKIKV